MPDIVVFAEAASDAEIVCGLADRVFVEKGSISQNNLAACRSWCGYEANTNFTQKVRIPDLFDGLKRGSQRPRNLGYIAGKPQKSHAAFWRKAVQLVVEIRKSLPVEGILIHCDVDNKPEQLDGLKQACGDPEHNTLAIVFATPDREIEAWLLNGFIPENPAEEKLLAEWKRKLKFNPCTQAERASIGGRDPKKIITALTNDDEDRRRRYWSETTLSTLRQRGEKTNLTQFLDEVETRLLRLLSN